MKKIILTACLIASFSTAALAETIHVGVNGLVCAFCAQGIEKSLKSNESVDNVTVDLEGKLVTINTKKDQTLDDKTITEIITDAGYNVTNIHHQK